jgi:Tol biopolymer transport system component
MEVDMKINLLQLGHDRSFVLRRVLFSLSLVSICTALLTSSASAVIVNHAIIWDLPDSTSVQNNWDLSPDGSLIVYLADPDVEALYNLYSVPARGGTPIKLNDTYTYGGSISLFAISPDSQYVVFVGDLNTDEVFELYSVPIEGGEQVRINGSLIHGGDVRSFKITPDSQGVVYYADQDEDEDENLYSVPIGGGTPIKLTSGIPEEYAEIYYDYKITPDSHSVVFHALREDATYGLFIVSIGGGSIQTLNESGEFSYYMSPDGQNLVFKKYQETTDTVDLYRVPATGGSPTRLSPALVSGGEVGTVIISPNSQKVVFTAEHTDLGKDDIFSVSMNGANLVELYSLNPGEYERGFKVAPNSLGVVYSLYRSATETKDIYSVYMNGLYNVQLNPDLPPGRQIYNFWISANSLGVVYLADQDMDEVFELYAVPSIGGDSIKLNPDLTFWQDVEMGFQISPNSQYVAYMADIYQDERFDLFVVPSVGGTSTRLNSDTYCRILRYLINPDSQSVIYETCQEPGQNELFIAYNAHVFYLPLVSH